MFVADVGYGQLNLTGSFGLERWPDVDLSQLDAPDGPRRLLPGASRRDGRRPRQGHEPLAPGLPYVALAAGYSVLIALAMGSVTGELIEVLYGAVVLTAMVLIRQELVLRENSRLLAEQARRELEERFGALAANSSEAVVLVDRDGRRDRRHGRRRARPRGRRFQARGPPDLAAGSRRRCGASPGLHRRCRGRAVGARSRSSGASGIAAGVWRQVETIAANLLDDPSVGQIVLTTRDVRERKTLERQLTQVALHDLLTGPPKPHAVPRPGGPGACERRRRPGADDRALARHGRLQARERRLWGTRWAIRFSRKSPAACAPRSAPPTPAPAWAGTSSGSCSTAHRRRRMAPGGGRSDPRRPPDADRRWPATRST